MRANGLSICPSCELNFSPKKKQTRKSYTYINRNLFRIKIGLPLLPRKSTHTYGYIITFIKHQNATSVAIQVIIILYCSYLIYHYLRPTIEINTFAPSLVIRFCCHFLISICTICIIYKNNNTQS